MDGITPPLTRFYAKGTAAHLLTDVVRSALEPSVWVPRRSRSVFIAVTMSALALPVLTIPSGARGPENIADIAEQVIGAVVNISTSQKVETRNSARRPRHCPTI